MVDSLGVKLINTNESPRKIARGIIRELVFRLLQLKFSHRLQRQ